MPSAKRSGIKKPSVNEIKVRPQMFMVPCSCGTTFVVDEAYGRGGGRWSRYLTCPTCGKRHHPKNRLLQIGYQAQGFWSVNQC
jgi:hypothetical protein